MNYIWKQRTYSYAHLISDNGKSLCRRTKAGGKWLEANPELGKCQDCQREADRLINATIKRYNAEK